MGAALCGQGLPAGPAGDETRNVGNRDRGAEQVPLRLVAAQRRQAWAEVILDVLDRVPGSKREEVLRLALRREREEREEEERTGGIFTLEELDMNEPGMRHRNAIMRLKSLLVQVFVRNITNNHSPENARAILFAGHPHGTGSRRLEDYLPKRKTRRNTDVTVAAGP